MHVFDEAIALQPVAEHRFGGKTSPAYWNMVGPYGGITAAVLLNAVLVHPQRLGEPLSITVNYAAAVAEGEFTIQATPVQTNRSTQHWIVIQESVDAAGNKIVASTATVVTAVRRETWSATDHPAPEVEAPIAQVQAPRRAPMFEQMQWCKQYEMLELHGALPHDWDGQERTDSRSLLWVRDAQPRPLDFASLMAMCDIFWPRIFLRRALQVPAGTVSLTVYFHASAQALAEVGTDYLLAQAQGQVYRNNYADEVAQVWSRAGLMLATVSQVLYFKQ